ncbi:CYtochrome P450 family [Caenorhabditis elegans]|uniref:CYtochrome P450 family n=2 Tax=Caenorhabditis elegans TaxID=6239 RepID=H2KY69_CAEEL|nr:CYtochrome P450 family [Caenorhabditis elegans]CCD61364.1 CYtochrome P450 family [Caenorhabditis elegans]|eukprot:NP_001041072.1 CYtochrome P450 family [Caenorhabditis elegans]
MILILILSAIVAIFTVNLWRARQKLPKGPTPLPLIGNLHQLIYNAWKNGGIVQGFNEFKKQYGNVFTIWMGPIPSVHIADFDVAHETHVKRANTFGHRFSNGGMDYIREGRGIIASNGEFWQEHRRFALTTLRNFGLGRNIMEDKIMEEYRYRFKDFKNTHFKNGGIQVNASSCFDLLVGSIINQLLVSERFEQDNKEFERLKTSLAKGLEKVSIFEAFMPVWVLKSKLMRWRTKTTFEPFDFIFGLVERGIQKRVSAIKNGTHIPSEEGEDFVDAFLIKMEKDKNEGIQSTFDLETLAVDLYDLWLAGQETTSTTLTWACACLLNYPEVVKEIRKELTEVTGGTRSLSLTDRPKTPYLGATINEIQRIASILNVNIFRLMEEDSIIEGQPISAGAVLTTQLAMLHTDEKTFKNHTEFRPERFLENNNLEKRLIPFGIGKRSCLGESLARAELYLASEMCVFDTLNEFFSFQITGNMILDFDFESVGAAPRIQTPTPFALMKRPPSYDIRFIPRSK